MKKLFVITVLACAMIACDNEKKSGEEIKTNDTTIAPSQAAAADSTAAKAAADSTANPADSTKK